MKRSISPAVVLFFLSPVIAELLSGSSPPAEFFNPFTFVLLAALYGSGAILARELTVRWRKGWASLFALGAAYGILEEGLMVKSFFDPHWEDLGILGTYGRWAGVNWVWCLELTFVHAVISIAVPILLVELIFPARRSESWIGRQTLIGLSALLAADVVFGYFICGYTPPLVPYLLAVATVGGLVLLAQRLPRRLFAPKFIRVPHPFWFWLTGFLGTLAFFLVFWGLPNTALPSSLTMLIGAGLMALIAAVAMRMSGNWAAWQDKHRLALAGGLLTLAALFAPLQELDNPNRPDDTTGMTVVGLAALVFLLWLWRRVRSRSILLEGER